MLRLVSEDWANGNIDSRGLKENHLLQSSLSVLDAMGLDCMTPHRCFSCLDRLLVLRLRERVLEEADRPIALPMQLLSD